MCLAMVLFVFMQMWRWSHSGMVCSGDFLGVDFPKPDQYPEYLIVEGRFLKAVIITIYIMIILSIATIAALAVFLSKRQASAEYDPNAARGRGMSLKMAPAYQTQIMNKMQRSERSSENSIQED